MINLKRSYPFQGSHYRHLIPVLIVMLAGGCTHEAERQEGHTFKLHDDHGVSAALSSAIPKYEEELFTYDLLFVTREDDRSESMLIRGETPSTDEHGFVFVPDSSPADFPSVSRIAVYDSTGSFIRSFGRSGQGPGEFYHPRITMLSDGVIDLFDIGTRRLSRFTTTGTLVDIISLPQSIRSDTPNYLFRIGDVRLLLISINLNFNPGSILDFKQELYRQKYVTMYTTSWDSLWNISTRVVHGGKWVPVSSGEYVAYMSVRPVFQPIPQIVCNKSRGILITAGFEPVLDLYSFDGDQYRRIRIDLPPRPVTSDDKVRFEAPLKAEIKDLEGMDREFAVQRLENIAYADTMGFWGEEDTRSIQWDEYGFIWIRIPDYLNSSDNGDQTDLQDIGLPIRYRVLSPEGEYLGITTSPERRRGSGRVSRGKFLAVMNQDTSESPCVAVWRISPAVPGLIYP